MALSRVISFTTRNISIQAGRQGSRDDDDKDDGVYDDVDAVAAGYDNDADEENGDHFNKAETEDQMTVMMTKTI